jgi:uncharacterized membrane protein
MTDHGPADPQAPSPSPDRAPPPKPALFRLLRTIRNRLLEGLLVLLPILVTLWVIWWLYSTLEKYVIDPLAGWVIWKGRTVQGVPELPYWFETYAAPLIAILFALVVLYCCGLLAHSRLRRSFDKLMLRVPVISLVYDAVQNVLKCFDQTDQQIRPQRIVLVPFPHPGMRLPAIVTSTCQDVASRRTVLCVYVPTTPVPASGFFLMIPEDEVTELNWDVQQTLQAIISGGLTAPREVTFGRLAPTGPSDSAPGVNQASSPDGGGK